MCILHRPALTDLLQACSRLACGRLFYNGDGMASVNLTVQWLLGRARQDLTVMTQPTLQLLALSACVPGCMPLVFIFGNRFRYIPIIYFSEHDVLLCLTRPIQYLDSDGSIRNVATVSFNFWW